MGQRQKKKKTEKKKDLFYINFKVQFNCFLVLFLSVCHTLTPRIHLQMYRNCQSASESDKKKGDAKQKKT